MAPYNNKVPEKPAAHLALGPNRICSLQMHLKSDLVEAYVAKGTSHFISINTIELKDNFYHDYRGVVKLSLA